MKVTLLVPCFIDACFPQAAISMVRVLERLGHTVEFFEDITCCGQPAFNAGCWNDAKAVAARVLTRLVKAEVVVIGSGSCGAMIKVFYTELFQGTVYEEMARAVAHKTFEFSDFLVSNLGVSDVGARFEARVTFHDGCHGLRELGIKRQPRLLLSQVRGLTLLEMDEEDTCCGFGGTFATTFPSISTAMGSRKCLAAIESGADCIVSNDLSCLMQLQGLLTRQGRSISTYHLAEVLAQT